MRTNIPPIREQVFEAYVEIPQKTGQPLRFPIVFTKTTRPWAQYFINLSRQANSGSEAEIAEDLFAGISPSPAVRAGSIEDLFGVLPSTPPRSAGAGEDPFGAPAEKPRDLSPLARHFLLMGA